MSSSNYIAPPSYSSLISQPPPYPGDNSQPPPYSSLSINPHGLSRSIGPVKPSRSNIPDLTGRGSNVPGVTGLGSNVPGVTGPIVSGVTSPIVPRVTGPIVPGVTGPIGVTGPVVAGSTGSTGKSTSIPNSLSITLLTKIPGFQKIKYKPSMTIPDDDKNEIVYFNPLIKINKYAINKIPQNTLKQFFNRGLYDSLLYESLSLNHLENLKNISLKEAKQKGYVDNNIQLTLETLFKPDNVIYIGKKPYVISNNIFDNSSWNLDIKETTPVSIRRNTAMQYNYNNAYNELEQLKQSDPEVIAGSTAPPTPIIPIIPIISSPPIIVPSPGPIIVPSPGPIIVPSPPIPPIIPGKKPFLTLPPIPPPILPPGPKPLLILPPNPPPVVAIHLPTSQNDIVNTDRFEIIDAGRVEPEIMRTYFLSYWWILNVIYKNVNRANKLLIQPPLQNDEPSVNISLPYYDGIVKRMQIIPMPMDGHCFFHSIAYAINYYNDSTQDRRKKITYEVNNSGIITTYGEGLNNRNSHVFTYQVIRRIVIDYYNENPDKLREVIEVAQDEVADLNTKYIEAVNAINPITREIRRNTIQNIWNDSEKVFLTAPFDDYDNVGDMLSFYVIQNPAEISAYIMSDNYWASQEIYAIIQQKLNINVITIQQTGAALSVKLTPTSKKNTSISDLLILPHITQEDEVLMGPYEKYMFLRHNGRHYDVITFRMDDISATKKTIFERLHPADEIDPIPLYDLNRLPPLYILFIIYGQYYSKKNQLDKEDVNLFSNQLNMIDATFNLPTVQNSPEVVNMFNTLFRQPLKPPLKQKGGINNPYSQPYNSQPYNSQPYNSQPYNSQPYNSQPYNSQPYNSQPYNTPLYGNNMSLVNQNLMSGPPSNLSYHITVELVLYPGTSIPFSKLPALICEKNSAVWSEAMSKLRGTVYAPRPSSNLNVTPSTKTLDKSITTDKSMTPDKSQTLDKSQTQNKSYTGAYTGGKRKYTRKNAIRKKYTRKIGIRKKYTRKKRKYTHRKKR